MPEDNKAASPLEVIDAEIAKLKAMKKEVTQRIYDLKAHRAKAQAEDKEKRRAEKSEKALPPPSDE